MSHRKAHSQGSIPFSWEDKPGISKTPNHDCPIHIGSMHAKNKKSTSTTFQRESAAPAIEDSKIPLPPFPLQRPRRSTSGKSIRWQQDPFLLAYKECTKDDKPKNKAPGSAYPKVKKSKYTFSCKTSIDAKDDHFVKVSRLPHLPRDKNPSLTLEDKHKLEFAWI